MKNRGYIIFRNLLPVAAAAIVFLLPLATLAQGSTADAVTPEAPPDVAGFTSSIKMLNMLLIVIGLELALITMMLAFSDPANFSLGALLGSVTGKTASEAEMDHEYDGIREIDNPVPAWLKMIFYATIVWGVGYYFYYHFSGSGLSQKDEYRAEMAAAETGKKIAAPLKLEELRVQTDPAALEEGKKVYNSVCNTCHGKEGQGDAGPNLTDEYWIHGGTISEIYSVISDGVPGKLMAAWKSTFTEKERLAVSSFILSLKGSDPPNPRKPEGEIFKGDPNSMPGAVSIPADSAKKDTMK